MKQDSYINNLVNGKYDVKEQTKRFQNAQANLDFTTMYEVLFQTTACYVKKKQGKFWNFEKIVDVSNDIVCRILNRYKKNPAYKIKYHATTVFYAYLGYVCGTLYKKEIEDSKTCSYEANGFDNQRL